ncbi:MAG: hypothetical protein JSS36_04760 [Proteobacteria bacterium]|nr:hypothetical protein [Pseudomonadota bacterium]
MNPAPPSLMTVAALARAGAVERAVELFDAHYAGRHDDSAVLAVLGRLRKSQSRLAGLAAQPWLMASATEAYAAAHRLDPQPYLAINAASTALLAGDAPRARDLAGWVVARLAAPEPVNDTRYYLAATRAEALLILGNLPGATAALAEAAQADPDGWDERAVTVAQLAELSEVLAVDPAWLDPFRPPAALHFAGHMGVAAGGAAEAAIAAATRQLIAAEKVGFAFGALAAGADIVIAEQVLAAGGELHLVLPAPLVDFRRQSVLPAGMAWAGRFDAVAARAASLRVVGPPSDHPHDSLATRLAGDVAIGASRQCARRYATRALQWLVLDEHGGGTNTAVQGRRWPDPASQHRLTVSRDADAEALYPPEESDPGRRDAVVMAIRLDLADLGTLPVSAELVAARAPVTAALAGLPAAQVRTWHDGWDILVDDLEAAVRLALAVQDAARAGAHRPAIGLARGLLGTATDALTGSLIWHGQPAELAERLAWRAPAGVSLCDALFAGCAALAGPAPWHLQPWLTDEPDLGGTAYLLNPVSR